MVYVAAIQDEDKLIVGQQRRWSTRGSVNDTARMYELRELRAVDRDHTLRSPERLGKGEEGESALT